MEYKTKGREGTGARAQKECLLTKVNKKQSVKEEKAEDISKEFPNFSVLSEEERQVFFKALSTARKNIEKQGLPARECFGTVHDEYLKYFNTNEEDEEVPETKLESTSSRWPSSNSNAVCERPCSSRKKTKCHKVAFPLAIRDPSKNSKIRPESAPVESLIKRETDKVVQMYLDKKKRVENKTPPARRIPQPTTRQSPRAPPPKPKAGASPKAANSSKFHALNYAERQEFFRVLRQAHDNVREKNPGTDMLSYDEMVNPYESGKEALVYAAAVKEPQTAKQKTLRVKVTLTSGDAKCLNRSKSQILTDCLKQEVNERSKSLENLHNPDAFRGKQSKIPVLKRPHQETEDYEPKAITITENLIKRDGETEAAPQVNRTLHVELKKPTEEVGKNGVIKNVAKERTRIVKAKDAAETRRKKPQDAGKNINIGMVKLRAMNLERRKTEFRRAMKEKENRAAEALKREKELQKKKRMDEWKKRRTRGLNCTNAPTQRKTSAKKTNKILREYCHKPVEPVKALCPPVQIEEEEVLEPEDSCVGVTDLEEEEDEEEECPVDIEDRDTSDEEGECSAEHAQPARREHKTARRGEIKKKSIEKRIPVPSVKPRTDYEQKEQFADERMIVKQKETLENAEGELKVIDVESCVLVDATQGVGERESLPEEGCSERRERQQCEHVKECEECEHSNECEECGDNKEYEECEYSKESEESGGSNEYQECEHSKEYDECEHSYEYEECEHSKEYQEWGYGKRHEECEKNKEREHSKEYEECECAPNSSQENTESSDSSSDPSESELCVISLPGEAEASDSDEASLWTCSCGAPHPGACFHGGGWTYRKPSCDHVKMYLVNDRFIQRIKNLVKYLESKVKKNENCESEYVHLVTSYANYLAQMTESLVLENETFSQRVHSTYTAHEVRLKFDDKSDEKTTASVPRSISDEILPRKARPIEEPSKTKEARDTSTTDPFVMADSDSSSDSEGEDHQFILSSFAKTGIPATKIRLLQDLLKGRAEFAPGSVDDFKIVHHAEPEYIPKDTFEPAKELVEIEEDQGDKGIGMKFFKHLLNLCTCGKKQLEEEAILENLKGEAVRVDTIDKKKDPTSATINQSTMEVLRAAERRQIIDKYFKT